MEKLKGIETKLIFPISRSVFLILATLSIIVATIFFLMAVLGWMSPDAKAYVAAEDVASSIQPLSSSTAESSARHNPLSTSERDDEKLSQMFPDSAADELYQLMSEGFSPRERNASDFANKLREHLTDKINEAQARGDNYVPYIANSVAVLKPIAANRRIQAYTVYHARRLQAVKAAQVKALAKAESVKLYAYIFGLTFVALLQVSLVLALLAIERNTRRTNAGDAV